MTPMDEDPMSPHRHVSIWEYRVKPENDGRFRDRYGPHGAWVRLFRRAEGHIATRLYRDREDPQRYITVDVWVSKAATQRFRKRFSSEYDALDKLCAELIEHEACLGEYEER